MAFAAPAADTDSGAISEVIVTANSRLASTVASKTETSLITTPQAISVVTADQIALRGAFSIQDSLGYSAGVRSNAQGNESRSESVRVRGEIPLQFLDGLRNGLVVYSTGRVDPYNIERIEVLKGPSSVLYGQGTIAGVLAMTSKRPKFSSGGEIVASYGTWDRKQIQADYTGPIGDSEDFAFRIVGLYRDADTQVDYIGDDRWFIAPSITWRPTDRTEITALFRRQEDRTATTTTFLPWQGTLFPNVNGRISSHLLAGEPTYDKYDTNQTDMTLVLRHEFNDVLTYRTNYRFSRASVDYQIIYPNVYSKPTDPFVQPGQAGYVGPQRSVARYLYANYPRSDTYAMDNQLLAKFSTGSIEHAMLAGVDSLLYKEADTGKPTTLIAPLDLFNPVYGNYAAPATVKGNIIKQKQLGFYAQDQLKIGDLNLLAGIRHDSAKSRTFTPAGAIIRKSDDATTYRFGAMYTLSNGLTPYVSYAKSFVPVAGTNLAGVPFKPQIGKQWEAGIKWQGKPGSIITASVYDLRDTNRVTTSPSNPFDRVQTGEIRLKGAEIEAQTLIGTKYEFNAAYTYTDAKVSKSNNVLEVGRPIASTPKHLASLWALRRIELGDDQLLRLGLGIRYSGKSWDRIVASPISNITTPAYTLADAVVSYDRDNWRFSLNVNNLTNKYYLASCLARGDCFLGARRTVVASIGYRF